MPVSQQHCSSPVPSFCTENRKRRPQYPKPRREGYLQQLEREVDELNHGFGSPQRQDTRGSSPGVQESQQDEDLEDLQNEIDRLNEDIFHTETIETHEHKVPRWSSFKRRMERELDELEQDPNERVPAKISKIKDTELEDQRRECFGNYGIRRNARDAILRIFNSLGHNLPRSSQVLMGTPRSVKSYIKEVSNGSFYYSGIESGLRLTITDQYLSHCKTISLDISWDGLSPYTSVKNKIWPILCRLSATNFSKESCPYIVAVFGGKSDPDPKEFLGDFVLEAKRLETNGIVFNGIRYEVCIQKFIADYPGRCRMKCVNGEGPSSLVQCERCTIVGKKRGGTQFTSVEVRRYKPSLRTYQTFRQKQQIAYHIHYKTGQRADSPLMELNVDMVFDLPMDPMHILYQGVVKRWWEFVVETKRSVTFHIKRAHREKISRFMEDEVGKYFPSEYARRVRGLCQYKLFKATEWRRFLLYDGVLVIKKFLSNAAYRNFLLLSCAVRILSSPDLFEQQELRSDAQRLLEQFVSDAELKFGKSFMSIKVHSLTHLVKDCEKHGVLESFSMFPFESYLKYINNAMRAHGRCIEQIVARMKEGHLLQPKRVSMRCNEKHAGAVFSREKIKQSVGSEREYLQASMPGMTICANRRRDSIVKTIDNVVLKVTSIVHDTVNDEVFVLGYKFLYSSNYFHWPMKSKVIGIEKVWGLDSQLSRWRIENLRCKCVLLKIDLDTSEWLCLPLVHVE